MASLIQADLHTHTLASSHAYSTITENCRAASEAGLKAIAMTDHFGVLPDTPHRWHFANMASVLPRKIFGVTVLKGAEVNIYNYNGDVDMDDKLLSDMEWVVASYHRDTFSELSNDPRVVTEGYMNLCRNPHIDVIGHPTTNFFPFEHERTLKAFKEYDKLVEINESSMMKKPGSFENAREVLKLCKRLEIKVVVDTDSHFWNALGVTPLAEKLVEGLDFPKNLILNTDWERVKEWILKKRPWLSLD